MSLKSKTTRLLVGTFLVYGLLVATHLGEFWPFSVYPMFSKAGRPWNRALVRDVSASTILPESQRWTPVDFDGLPGAPIQTDILGISQNDLANMVSKTKVWNADRVEGLRVLFKNQLGNQTLMVYKARGEKTGNSDLPVKIEFTPFIMMTPDTTIFNPNLEVKTQ